MTERLSRKATRAEVAHILANVLHALAEPPGLIFEKTTMQEPALVAAITAGFPPQDSRPGIYLPQTLPAGYAPAESGQPFVWGEYDFFLYAANPTVRVMSDYTVFYTDGKHNLAVMVNFHGDWGDTPIVDANVEGQYGPLRLIYGDAGTVFVQVPSEAPGIEKIEVIAYREDLEAALALAQSVRLAAPGVRMPEIAWERVEELPKELETAGIEVLSEADIWTAGECLDGTHVVMHSSDSGTTWTTLYETGLAAGVVTETWSRPDFVDPEHGWMLVTQDLGQTPEGSNYTGWNYQVMTTDDGGSTWTRKPLTASFFFPGNPGIVALDAKHAVVYGAGIHGWGAALLSTTDGGDTWAFNPPEDASWGVEGILAADFLDENHGWIVGHEGEGGFILRTADGGETWTRSSPDAPFPLVGVAFLDETYGIAVGPDGALQTKDGGVTWSDAPAPQGSFVTRAGDYLWLTTLDGGILRGTLGTL